MPSAAIRDFSYDPDRNELTIVFTNDRSYIYSLVPPDVYATLKATNSRGAFVNRHIRDRYPFRQTGGSVKKPARRRAPKPSLLDMLRDSAKAEAASRDPTGTDRRRE